MDPKFMRVAIKLAQESLQQNGGGPFGAVVVKDNNIIGGGSNQVTSLLDPTAHAEIGAIRQACKKINDFSLAGCALYTSCEPCPMCLGAVLWARIDSIYYGATMLDAASINFDDYKFYQEVRKPKEQRAVFMKQLLREECLALFKVWEQKEEKILY